MSYMVIECHSSYAILLDEDGRFLKAANLRYEVGQTVYDPVLMREKAPRLRHYSRWLTNSAAAVAACFLLVFGISCYQNHIVPYSSIYLSINPEVQMDLNRQGTVVELTGINTDGKALLEGYDGDGKDKVTVADELIDKAIDMGYLSEGGQVSFSIDTPDEALFTEYGIELRSGVARHLEGRAVITIEIFDHTAQQNMPSQPHVPAVDENKSPSQPETPPAASAPEYNDTDYGAGNDSVTVSIPPAVKPSTSAVSGLPADMDSETESGGVTDYNDANYGSSHDDVSDYTPAASAPPETDNGDSAYQPDDYDIVGDSNSDSNDDDSDDDGDDDSDDDSDDNSE